MAQDIYSVGEKKNISFVKYKIFNSSGSIDEDILESASGNIDVMIVQFNSSHIDSPNVVFCSSEIAFGSNNYYGLWENDSDAKFPTRNFLNNHYSDIFPDPAPYMKQAKCRSHINGENFGNVPGLPIWESNDYIFPPSASAVGNNDYAGENERYAYFSSDESRKMLNDSSPTEWGTRSCKASGMNVENCVVTSTGGFSTTVGGSTLTTKWMPLCFVIG